MKRFLALAALSLLPILPLPAEETSSVLTFEAKEGPGKGKRIVFITGEEYYRSEEGMPMFARILSERHGFDCTVLFAIDPRTGTINPNQRGNIPGLEALAGADLMVLFTRFRELPDTEMRWIVEHVEAGKPVMAFRNATHPFRYSKESESLYRSWAFNSQEWPGGFGQQILGDTWVSHYGKFLKESTIARRNPEQKDHPVLRGVGEELFARTDVNEVKRLTPEDTVLFHAFVLPGQDRYAEPVEDGRSDTPQPWAWFRTYKAPRSGLAGRSFCLTAGSSTDWLEEDLRRLVVNAVYSLTGMEEKIPERNDVGFVGEYKPSPYGSHTDEEWVEKALRPADFADAQQ